MSLEKIFKFEAVIPMLLYLKKKREASISELIKELDPGQAAIYNALDRFENKLFHSEVEMEFPFRKKIRLTELGEQIAEKIEEIQRLISSDIV